MRPDLLRPQPAELNLNVKWRRFDATFVPNEPRNLPTETGNTHYRVGWTSRRTRVSDI